MFNGQMFNGRYASATRAQIAVPAIHRGRGSRSRPPGGGGFAIARSFGRTRGRSFQASAEPRALELAGRERPQRVL
jgi:hypothetical protein